MFPLIKMFFFYSVNTSLFIDLLTNVKYIYVFRYKVFIDLFNLTTFLVPHHRIPPLTQEVSYPFSDPHTTPYTGGKLSILTTAYTTLTQEVSYPFSPPHTTPYTGC